MTGIMESWGYTEEDYRKFFYALERKNFIPKSQWYSADLDEPLSIGHGQTISQPSLVLEMTILLDPEPSSRVLEIGTGSGYQTAFLAYFCKEVYTVERVRELSLRAEKALTKIGYSNVCFRIGDGSNGWKENAPYDRIMVTAASGKMPKKLLEQLKPGGKMVLPFGPPNMQNLLVVRKDKKGKVHSDSHEMVRFVEFVGEYGWHQE